MTENRYKSYRFVDGKARWVIVDENRDITNRNPSKEELKELEKESHQKYTKHQLLKYLVQFDKENGRIPVANDFNNKNPKYPSLSTYIKNFGSWNNALKLARLDINNFTETDEELLKYLIQFYQENGKVPGRNDFNKNSKYPSFGTYCKRFGNWSNALKLVGLDSDSLIQKGLVNINTESNESLKGRLFEILVKYHFEKESEDLSGKNCKSPIDGICPTGRSYEAKSSKLHWERRCWIFGIKNEYKAEYYYFGAFDEEWSKIKHVWRVPGYIIKKDNFLVGLSRSYEFNVENMKEYEITENFLNNLMTNIGLEKFMKYWEMI